MTDPKSTLQHLAQTAGFRLPQYSYDFDENTLIWTVSVQACSKTSTATGASKKEASKKAASMLVDILTKTSEKILFVDASSVDVTQRWLNVANMTYDKIYVISAKEPARFYSGMLSFVEFVKVSSNVENAISHKITALGVEQILSDANTQKHFAIASGFHGGQASCYILNGLRGAICEMYVE